MTERAWANAWALSLSGGDATSNAYTINWHSCPTVEPTQPRIIRPRRH
jgi:hypothetical protein